jgi:hypothetical protein
MSVHVTNKTPWAVDMTTISAGNDEFSFSTTGGADLFILVWHGVFPLEKPYPPPIDVSCLPSVSYEL